MGKLILNWVQGFALQGISVGKDFFKQSISKGKGSHCTFSHMTSHATGSGVLYFRKFENQIRPFFIFHLQSIDEN